MRPLILLFCSMILLFSLSCKQAQKERKETKPNLQKVDDKSFVNKLGMKMIYLTDAYWVSAYETTTEEYSIIMHPQRQIPKDKKKIPITVVSYKQAENFCKKLTLYEKNNGTLPAGYVYALPTEKMWRNYVADAKFEDAVFDKCFLNEPYTVGTLSPNRLGLYDVRGNVFEWTSNWYNPKTKRWGKAMRGGSFLSNTLEYWDIDNRACMSGGGARSCDVGFRVVLIPKAQQN